MNVSVHFSSLSWPYAVPTAQILFSFSFYLFLAALVLCCCRGLSLVAGSGVLLCRYMGFSLQWLLLLQSTGSRVCRLQQLQPMGSVAVVHRLSCPTACGVFLDQGLNQCPLRCKVNFFLILFYLTLQYCIGFAIYQNESATGIHVFPILNPPPSSLPYPPSGSFQCTSPKHPVSCIEHGLATRFIYDIIHISMPFSQIIPPSPSPTESKRLFYTLVSLLLSRIQGYCSHLSKFHIYALVYCIGVFLSGLLHSV